MKLLIGLIAVGGILAGLAGTLFGNHSYTVTAYFLSAEGVTQENDVVVNGARVGKVVSVGIAPDNGQLAAGKVPSPEVRDRLRDNRVCPNGFDARLDRPWSRAVAR